LAGASYAVALAVKIAPILVAPAMLVSIRDRGQRRRFVLVTAAASALWWLPALAADLSGVVREVFLYRGLSGVWGLSSLVGEALGSSPSASGRELWTMLLLIAVLVSGFVMGQRGSGRIEAAVATSFLVFLALTPGFGVQYLAWPVVFLIAASPVLGSVYSAAAGTFLYATYAWWSGGGWSLGYANAWSTSPGWSGTGEVLKWVVWLMILAMAFALHVGRRGPAAEDALHPPRGSSAAGAG
jgi:hypothetical protein